MFKQNLRLFSLILIIFSTGSNAFPTTQFSFDKFPYNDKLPSNSVQRIYNDKEGYMWFGTKDGLCRFDGYRTRIFRSSSINHNRLTNNNIQCIAEDNQNRLWIGTIEGINILDKSNYSITPYDNSTIGRDRISDLCVDKAGSIWVATSGRGIIRIDRSQKNHIYQYNAKLGSIPSNRVSSIYQDREGNIWVMFWEGGLALYQPKQDNFKTLPPIGNSNNPIRMLEDRNHNYWICTWGDGMFALDYKNKSNNPFTPVSFTKNGKSIKMSNIMYSIIQDPKMGYLWIISFSGLDVLEIKNNHTLNSIDSESMFNEPCNKLFHDIIVDQSKNLWLGSVGEGIYKLDFSKSSFQSNTLASLTKKIGFSPNVYHICEATNNKVHIVLDRLGLYTLNLQTGALTQASNPLFQGAQNIQVIYHIKSKHEIWIVKEEGNNIYIVNDDKNNGFINAKTITIDKTNHSAINCLFEDSHGNIWIGFDQGLYKRSPDGKIALINSKIANINSISKDKKGNIWVGTEKQGVFKIQLNSKQSATHIVNFSEKSGNLQSNSIQSVCCGKYGNVYIGAREGSLYLYNEIANQMIDISNKYGITEDAIQDIVEDNYGLLWISTVKKIIRYNPSNHVSTYYTSSDGILVSSFSKSAGIKLQNGQILFGGNKGLCLFSPVATSEQPAAVSKVTITNIDVNNQSIFDHSNESHFDSQRNTLILQPKDDNISLEFSSLNYSAAEKIQYAYRLIGIDKDWVYLGNDRRYVNYTNLPTGRYTFEVKATDENGQWCNQISSLTIIKRPPFYLTWWAYLLYLAIIVGSTYFVLKNIAHRIRLRNELKISHIEKVKSEELAQIKLRYFTNISHELLTPLTIIMLLIENLQKKNSGDSSQFEIMKDNIIRLKRLIQQILVFRKTESGNMKLKIRQNDVVAFVNNICQSNFRPLINEKEINFSIVVEHESYMAYFDPDKLDKVIYNLLSNAFKHTPRKGSIAVKISFVPRLDDVFMRLSVSDTGDGIAEQDIPHIFKRFYISSTSDQSQSHGIGLALTYDLLQIHKGSIEVKSQLGQGAVFTIEIPVTQGYYTEEELWNEDNKMEDMLPIQDIVSINSTAENQEKQDDKKELAILVVEDNQELKNLIVDYFSNRYSVLSADNGVQALEIIANNEIDLIISDVMMPEMDGLTLCKILKNDIATSHIDVLMLTAKNSSEDRIECYNAGADAYIAKPFEMAVLNARTRNLIQKRLQKTNDFKNNKDVNISSMEYGSIDEVFLNQAILKVEEKLADDTFDFDQFAIDMVTSKSTLYRKLKSLTDLSPVEFIRNIRLKHAAQMLTNNAGNISEIAFAVGFNDPKHFSKCFKTEFGLTPREYQKSQKIHE